MQIQYGARKARKTRKTWQNNKIHNIHVIISSYLLFTINLFAEDLIKPALDIKWGLNSEVCILHYLNGIVSR